MTFELTKEGEILQFTHTYIVAYPKLLTLTSTLAPSNDPVTILGPDENLVNMMKSMSPCLPTISFPLQSPCPPCQAAINVSMTRLRLLLSHHARATHTPSSAQDNTLQTAPPHHTIYPTIAAFCLILLPPVSFCLVTHGTHPLIIPPTVSRPTQNSKNAPDAQNSTTRECRTEEQSGGVAQSNHIKRHPAICLSKESTEGRFAEKMHFSSPASGLRNASSVERCRGFALKQGSVASASEESWKGSLVAVHRAIMSTSPYLKSIQLYAHCT